MSPLPGFPVGSLWKEMPVTRAFFYITFRVPIKGVPPLGSLHRAPIERGAPFPEPFFNCLLEFLVNRPP